MSVSISVSVSLYLFVKRNRRYMQGSRGMGTIFHSHKIPKFFFTSLLHCFFRIRPSKHISGFLILLRIEGLSVIACKIALREKTLCNWGAISDRKLDSSPANVNGRHGSFRENLALRISIFSSKKRYIVDALCIICPEFNQHLSIICHVFLNDRISE